MQLTIAKDLAGLQEAIIALTRQGKRIGLVPTMGALHEGHMSLVNVARQRADAVVASIFVNPKQFGHNEDFSKYPRMLESDIKKLDEAGAAVVYTPSAEDMYPEGYNTTVSAGALGEILCGKFRPGHFDGVATVVTKLLMRVLPHVAVFGEKDYQQLCVISRVVRDLDIPIEVVGAHTLRAPDGLAMSSRNIYLTEEERKIAPRLHETLNHVAANIIAGKKIGEATAEGAAMLEQAGFKVDYVELRAAFTLEEMKEFSSPARLLAAAWLGKTRLIDNIAVEKP